LLKTKFIYLKKKDSYFNKILVNYRIVQLQRCKLVITSERSKRVIFKRVRDLALLALNNT